MSAFFDIEERDVEGLLLLTHAVTHCGGHVVQVHAIVVGDRDLLRAPPKRKCTQIAAQIHKISGVVASRFIGDLTAYRPSNPTEPGRGSPRRKASTSRSKAAIHGGAVGLARGAIGSSAAVATRMTSS